MMLETLECWTQTFPDAEEDPGPPVSIDDLLAEIRIYNNAHQSPRAFTKLQNWLTKVRLVNLRVEAVVAKARSYEDEISSYFSETDLCVSFRDDARAEFRQWLHNNGAALEWWSEV